MPLPPSQLRLDQLVELPLSRIGCALDLLWMQFGPLREEKSLRGTSRMVGDFALHVNVPWRFCRNSKILIGNRDMYFYGGGESYDFDRGGASRFHLFADRFNAELELHPLSITSISSDDAGSLSIQLTNGHTFEAFPNVSHDSPGFEFWRLLRPYTESQHLIRETSH